MPAPAWLTYVGAITGIVGAFTGIAGAVISYVNYRRVSKIKTLDLRLELRKLASDTAAAVDRLPRLIEDANQSRFHVRAALGTLNTGPMDAWKVRVQADRDAIRELRGSPAVPDDGYRSLTHEQLETTLVKMHALRRRVDEYAQQYRAEIAADDKDRDFIRDRAHARFQQ